MSYSTKRALIAIIVFVAVFKILGFGASVHHVIGDPSKYTTISLLIAGVYLLVQLFGLIAAAKDRPCGLKMFGILQVMLVVASFACFAVVLWTQGPAVFHSHSSTANNNLLDTDNAVTLNDYKNGQDVVKPTIDAAVTTEQAHTELAPSDKAAMKGDMEHEQHAVGGAKSKKCNYSKYTPFLLLGLSILLTTLDLMSAVLAFKGYRELVAADTAIETLTYLSEGADSEIPMTSSSPQPPQPLNVIYVPANLYDPLQTGLRQ